MVLWRGEQILNLTKYFISFSPISFPFFLSSISFLLCFFQSFPFLPFLTISQYISEGSALSRYTHVLALLLKLRQCCDHPYLVLSHAADSDSKTSYSPFKLTGEGQGEGQVLSISTSFVDKALESLKKKEAQVFIFIFVLFCFVLFFIFFLILF